MRKIVQLEEYEYHQLKKEADMNNAAIAAEVKREIDNKCNLSIDLKMEINNDWEDTLKIKPCVYVHSGSYNPDNSFNNSKYALSFDACKKIQKHIEAWMEKQVRKRYKLDVDVINRYRLRLRDQWKWNTAFLILSVTGWIAAILTWILD